ncbi:ABC transporter permease [Saxibacter everestensis]|uniref:ABC transporter permease n=1 Tax=Saxibacter everestensis TaxID=2909229 RepID=A0ABY8QSV9_9MICO|nr:ABC transporter permease [Brevibacteriaceae bacterium ZFBP1038]
MIVQTLQRSRSSLGIVGTIAAVILALIIVAAILAPLLTPHDPTVGSVLKRYLGPGPGNLLGTDQAGRDLFSRLLYGARSTLLGALIVVVVTASCGTMLALIASWWGGWVDAAISRVLDFLFAFPNLLLAVLVTAIYGSGMLTASLALSVAYIPYTARVIRSVSLRERGLSYVRSAELQGIPGVVIAGRHLLPNVGPQILTGATINFGYAMIDLAALSFLGLGVQAPKADWGLMVSNGQASLQAGYPAESVLAGTCIVITVACAGYLGERLGGRRAAGRA